MSGKKKTIKPSILVQSITTKKGCTREQTVIAPKRKS